MRKILAPTDPHHFTSYHHEPHPRPGPSVPNPSASHCPQEHPSDHPTGPRASSTSMDPDQVESAGINDHDRLAASAGGEDSWARALLRRGWDLSRKAAIAGAAATAAPVVAPPLIVLSATSIVLAVPFAAYLASLVATNHLMGALLPSSPPQPYHTCYQEDDDVEDEFLDASDEYGQEALACGQWNKTEEGEENESDTTMLLLRGPAVSEAPVPTIAHKLDDEVDREFFFQESGHESLTSNIDDKAVGTRKEAVRWGFDVSESAEPLSQDEDNVNVVQRKGGNEVVVQESGQESFESKHCNEEEDGTTMKENKSSEETVSQGFYFAESLIPLPGDDNNVVQGYGEGEFAVQNSGQGLFLSNKGDKKEERITMEEKKSTESSAPVFQGEDNVIQSNGEVEVTVQGLMEEVNSNTDLVAGEVVEVQAQIVTTAMPESEVLLLSNPATCESRPDLVTGEVLDVQVDIVGSAPSESEGLPPSNLVAFRSLADVTREIVDVPVDIVVAAVPESERLLLSNIAACESRSVAETACDGDVVGITVMEDIVRDVNKEVVERRFVSVPTVVSMHDGEDVISSGSTPYVSTFSDDTIGSNDVAADEIHCTEEQLREQLDTIITITGYRAVPCSTLESELGALYMFVGMESPAGSSDTSDRLTELNAKLQFLKSIIGVD